MQSNKFQKEQIISDNLQKKIDKEISIHGSDKSSTFYNVKYSGLDLEGNRYTISSKKAVNSDTNENVVNMSGVSAVFYFKDNTELNILSNKAIYNNKTLDIKFEDSVKCLYENSELYAGSAEFLNSKSSLIVSNNVKIIDSKGTIFADKLTFDAPQHDSFCLHVCFIILQYVARCCTMLHYARFCMILHYFALCLHYFALFCTILHYFCSILHYLALFCITLHYFCISLH